MTERKEVNPVTLEGYKEYRGDVDIFVPENLEETYLREHAIEIKKLDNGFTIATVTKTVSDENTSYVNVEFPTGAYFEPEKQRGITHLLEHFIGTKAFFQAPKNDVDYNAFTSVENVQIMINGTSNPNVTEYGIWPIIPLALEPVVSGVDISDYWLEKEKSVVLSEKHEKEANPDKVIQRIINKIIFSSNNPINYDGLGDINSLSNITVEDIYRRFNEVFIPSGAIVTIRNVGNESITTKIRKSIEKQLGNMQSTRNPVKLDSDAYAELNPDFNNGGFYTMHSGANKNISTIQFSWILPSRGYSLEDVSNKKYFNEVMRPKLTKFFRELGLGYISGVDHNDYIDKFTIYDLKLRIPEIKEPEQYLRQLYPLLKKEVVDGFSSNDLNEANNKANLRSRALPIAINSRFDGALTGLKRYGRVIDSEKVLQLYLSTSEENLRASAEKFIATDPAMIVIT